MVGGFGIGVEVILRLPVGGRNLRDGAPVRVVLRGRRLEGRAEAILDDDAAIGVAWAAYAAKFPKAAAALRTGDEAVFVRITLSEEGDAKP